MDNQPLDYNLGEQSSQLASKGQRFGNYIIDVIAFYMIYGVLAYVFFSSDPASENGLMMMSLFAPLAVFVGYFGLMEGAMGGKTLGKLITKTRAVNADGSRITMGNALLRSLCRMIPFEPLSIFFGDGFRMWHDTITKTQVVRD